MISFVNCLNIFFYSLLGKLATSEIVMGRVMDKSCPWKLYKQKQFVLEKSWKKHRKQGRKWER